MTIEIRAQNTVSAVAFARHGYIVAGDQTGQIRRWTFSNGAVMEQEPPMSAAGVVHAIAVSKDGRWIVSGHEGCKATVWNAANHAKAVEFSEHKTRILSIDVSSDSTRVITGAVLSDKTARVFSITSGQRLLEPIHHPRAVVGAKYSPDGNRIATAALSNSVRVYDANLGRLLISIPVQTQTWPITPLAWSPDNRHLFAVSPGRVTCLDVTTSSTFEWSIHNNDNKASVVTNGRFVACSAGSLVSFWDPVSRCQIDVNPPVQHPGQINCIALSPDEKYLACVFGNIIAIHHLKDILPPSYFNSFVPLMEVSEEALVAWTQSDMVNTERILSDEMASSSNANNFHSLANRSLVRTRSNQAALAIEDVNESLKNRPSPIGHIAMAVALLREDDRDGAEARFSLAFHDCEPNDTRFLLLLQAVLMFECGKQDAAIARIECLLTRVNADTAYPHNQVLGSMYMKREEYGSAIAAFDRAKQIVPDGGRSPPLVAISLIFGWTFDELDNTARRRMYEISFTEGRMSEASEILLSIIKSSASKEISDWLVDFHQRHVAVVLNAGYHPSGTVVEECGLQDIHLSDVRM